MSVMSSNGVRHPLFGSDETAATMEHLQFTLGEGPCVEASASGSPVLVPDLNDPGTGVRARWPLFLAEAAATGVRAIFAFPVRMGAISLGAVDLYRRSPGPLPRQDLARTLTTVDAIAEALLDGSDGLEGLDGGGLSAMVVHRAAGMIMVQVGCSIEDALLLLRAAAYAEGVPINRVADDVINQRRRFQEEP